MHVREVICRAEKVDKLVNLLRSIGACAWQVARMDDLQWQMAAAASGVRLPSAVTRQQVCARLKELERVEKARKAVA